MALSSVIAAIFLTGTKVAIGIWTGSLGILSEAAHSGLDLVAAIITLFAVKSSGKPADEEHLYGHEKVENLSALFETFLLLITCIWIIAEAFKRLFFHEVEIELSIWAFGVVILSIIIDLSRSRALIRAAQKHDSQALEADALHFSTDVWSSCVVLLGLILVWIGEQTGTSHILRHADPIAALGVAMIVIFVSVKLGKRCIDALLDSAPAGLAKKLERAVRNVPGVKDCHRLRVRKSGKRSFVDLAIDVEKGLSVNSAHLIAQMVEREIMGLLPNADVVVVTDSSSRLDGNLNKQIRAHAEALEHKVHNIFVYQQEHEVRAELHLEVPGSESILKAHRTAMELESGLLNEISVLKGVDIHIEPRREEHGELEDITANVESLEQKIKMLVKGIPGILDCHAIVVRKNTQGLFLSMHAIFDNEMSMEAVHIKLSQAERVLFRELPTLQRVLVHPEPLEYGKH